MPRGVGRIMCITRNPVFAWEGGRERGGPPADVRKFSGIGRGGFCPVGRSVGRHPCPYYRRHPRRDMDNPALSRWRPPCYFDLSSGQAGRTGPPGRLGRWPPYHFRRAPCVVVSVFSARQAVDCFSFATKGRRRGPFSNGTGKAISPRTPPAAARRLDHGGRRAQGREAGGAFTLALDAPP